MLPCSRSDRGVSGTANRGVCGRSGCSIASVVRFAGSIFCAGLVRGSCCERRMIEMKTPTIRELRVRAVRVPMAEPHRTATGVVSESPLVLIDVVTEDGLAGHGIVFTYTSAALRPVVDLVINIEGLVKGEPLAPTMIADKLAAKFRLLGTQGLVG